jgi:hypothetical protein
MARNKDKERIRISGKNLYRRKASTPSLISSLAQGNLNLRERLSVGLIIETACFVKKKKYFLSIKSS